MIKTIFLNKNTKNSIKLSTNINIILSVEFYWVRIFELPISSKKEVLAIVPNLFEEFFDISGYKFYVIKLENNKYLSFAYKQDDIIQALNNANIDYKKINNIFFAQNEINFTTHNIEINNSKYTFKDDILIQIPPNIASTLESTDIDIDNIVFSKHKISLNRTSKYIDTKSAFILSGIFIVLSLVIFTKSFILNQIINNYPVKIQKLKNDYNLMDSKMQTKSILKQYDKISNKFKNTREILEYIFNFKRKVQGRLTKIEFQNGVINCYFTESSLAELKKYFEKKYKNISSSKSNNKIKIGIKL